MLGWWEGIYCTNLRVIEPLSYLANVTKEVGRSNKTHVDPVMLEITILLSHGN